MQELDLNWARLLSILWLVAWRTTVADAVLTAAGLAILDRARQHGELSLDAIHWAVLGVMLGDAAVLFLVIRMALRKRYRGFRIALVAV